MKNMRGKVLSVSKKYGVEVLITVDKDNFLYEYYYFPKSQFSFVPKKGDCIKVVKNKILKHKKSEEE